MKKIFLFLLSIIIIFSLVGCKARTPIIDWVIHSISTKDGIFEVKKVGLNEDLCDHTSLTTDKITISFDENNFKFVDYYNNKYEGTYSREKNSTIKMTFDNGEIVEAKRHIKNIPYRSEHLIFTFKDIEYEFYEICDRYSEYTAKEYENDLRTIGSNIREVYEDDDLVCDHTSNYCSERICRGEIIISDEKITLKCLKERHDDIDLSAVLNNNNINTYIYEIDSTNLVKVTKDIQPGVCVYRPMCGYSNTMALYMFKE